ncbi:hypothetical protein E4U43_002144 [Claviceps pusilla]|uniref:Uncharacterized protein n=1 Tax=Claviceps pusilla TaxID=123648 RepID=A0A9P7NFY1_9HYPO|nr:hypothetical protein E4U43_002144 [Claviceps pusilla]
MTGVGGPQMPVEPIVRATIRAVDTLDADDAQCPRSRGLAASRLRGFADSMGSRILWVDDDAITFPPTTQGPLTLQPRSSDFIMVGGWCMLCSWTEYDNSGGTPYHVQRRLPRMIDCEDSEWPEARCRRADR